MCWLPSESYTAIGVDAVYESVTAGLKGVTVGIVALGTRPTLSAAVVVAEGASGVSAICRLAGADVVMPEPPGDAGNPVRLKPAELTM